MKARYAVPLAIFVVLVAFLGIGLKLDPRLVPSPLVDKAAPTFTLPRLDDPATRIGPDDLRGRVWLLNVWASWCVSCRVEHPILVELARRGDIAIVGLNYKDEQAAAREWLQRYGDPYLMSVVDADGRVGIDWGVYGVPETFVIDKRGTIRFKHIGPVDQSIVEEQLIPLVRELEQEAA